MCSNKDELKELRNQIDQIDNQLLKLIEERLSVAHKIGQIKKVEGLPIQDLEREKILIQELLQEKNPDISERMIEDIWEILLKSSRAIQE